MIVNDSKMNSQMIVKKCQMIVKKLPKSQNPKKGSFKSRT